MYTLAISLFALQVANAQFTITQSAFSPAVGDSYKTATVNGAAPIDLNTTGEGLLWDFSSMSEDGESYVTNILDASGSMDYPDAEFSHNPEGLTAVTYAKADATGLYVLAQEAAQGTIIYTGGRKLLHFPMSYETTNVDTYTGTNTNFLDNVFNLDGTVSMTADAYGDIILPYGTTLTNVMRVKTITEYTGEGQGLGLDMVGYETSYSWYHEDYTYPVLTHIVGTVAVGPSETPIAYTIYATASELQALDLVETEKNALAFYPNPARDFIQLSAEESIEFFEVYNMNGAQVKTAADLSNSRVNVSDLERGLYFVKYQTASSTYTQKLVLQ